MVTVYYIASKHSSVQGLSAKELQKIETIWHNFLIKVIANGFKRKNVQITYLKEKRSNPDTQEPDDLDWSYVFTNNQLEQITKTSSISNFCKTQHLKYIAHVTRLTNYSLQRQIFFHPTTRSMLVIAG